VSSPFITGTVDILQRASIVSGSFVLAITISHILDSTRAVSSMDSFLPKWISLGDKNKPCPPRRVAATSNETLVLVDPASNIMATDLSLNKGGIALSLLASFSIDMSSIISSISLVVKSFIEIICLIFSLFRFVALDDGCFIKFSFNIVFSLIPKIIYNIDQWLPVSSDFKE